MPLLYKQSFAVESWLLYNLTLISRIFHNLAHV